MMWVQVPRMTDRRRWQQREYHGKRRPYGNVSWNRIKWDLP